jgi:hypothetical protein
LAQESRHFTFHYAFTVKNLPAGQERSHLDSCGTVRRLSGSKVIFAKGDLPLKKTSESKYGNEIYYAETNSAQPELHFDVEYDVVRHERVALGATHSVSPFRSSTEGAAARSAA